MSQLSLQYVNTFRRTEVLTAVKMDKHWYWETELSISCVIVFNFYGCTVYKYAHEKTD